MRERPVPCRNASPREVMRGTHTTWNDSAVCDRCQAAALSPDPRRAPSVAGTGGPRPRSPRVLQGGGGVDGSPVAPSVLTAPHRSLQARGRALPGLECAGQVPSLRRALDALAVVHARVVSPPADRAPLPKRGGDEMTLVQPEGVPSPNRAAVDGYAGSSDGRASGARMTGPTEPASVGEGCRQTPRGESSGCQGQPIVAPAVDGARGVHGAPGTPSQS